MATVIDSLVVKLGLDNSGMKKGSAQAKGDLKDLSKGAKDTQSAFDDAGNAAGRFLALLGGAVALKSMVVDVTTANAQLGRLATNLGLAVSSMSAFGNAARIAGGSANSAVDAIERISEAQTQLKVMGESAPMMPLLNFLGIGLGEMGGRKDPVKVMMQLNEAFGRLKAQGKDADAFNLAKQLFGKDTAQFLMMAPDQFKKVYFEQMKQAAVTKEQAEKSEELRRAWTEFQIAGEATARSIVEFITPALLMITKGLAKLAENKAVVVTAFAAIAVAGVAAGLAILGAWSPLLATISAVALGVAAIAGVSAAVIGAFGGSDKDNGSPDAGAGKKASFGEMVEYGMQKHGLDRDHAIAMAVNAQHESSLNPSATNNGADGMFQWRGSRKKDFEKEMGGSILNSSWQKQYDFAMKEMKTGKEQAAGYAFFSAKGASASGALSSAYERHGNTAEDNRRMASHMNYAKMNNYPSSSSRSVTTGDIIVNTQATDAKGTATAVVEQLNLYAYQMDGGTR